MFLIFLFLTKNSVSDSIITKSSLFFSDSEKSYGDQETCKHTAIKNGVINSLRNALGFEHTVKIKEVSKSIPSLFPKKICHFMK
jgi:hypothetical protein